MKRYIFSFLFIFLSTNAAYASCQWGYINALNIDITHAREQLSTYSTCRGNCKSLEANLNRSITKMSKASSCAAHIFTRGNKDMINFIAGRFRLIQKQKLGNTWTAAATAKPVVVRSDESVSVPLEMDKPAFVEPQRIVMPQQTRPVAQAQVAVVTPYVDSAPPVQARKVAQPSSAVGQTRMRISNEAYSALWDEPKPRAAQRNFQRAVVRKPQVNHHAKQKQLAQQRLIQHRKQALVQQKKMHLMKVKRRAMQNHLNQQRLKRQQLLKRREVARQLNRQRVQQRRRVMALRRSQ